MGGASLSETAAKPPPSTPPPLHQSTKQAELRAEQERLAAVAMLDPAEAERQRQREGINFM